MGGPEGGDATMLARIGVCAGAELAWEPSRRMGVV